MGACEDLFSVGLSADGKREGGREGGALEEDLMNLVLDPSGTHTFLLLSGCCGCLGIFGEVEQTRQMMEQQLSDAPSSDDVIAIRFWFALDDASSPLPPLLSCNMILLSPSSSSSQPCCMSHHRLCASPM